MDPWQTNNGNNRDKRKFGLLDSLWEQKRYNSIVNPLGSPLGTWKSGTEVSEIINKLAVLFLHWPCESHLYFKYEYEMLKRPYNHLLQRDDVFGSCFIIWASFLWKVSQLSKQEWLSEVVLGIVWQAYCLSFLFSKQVSYIALFQWLNAFTASTHSVQVTHLFSSSYYWLRWKQISFQSCKIHHLEDEDRHVPLYRKYLGSKRGWGCLRPVAKSHQSKSLLGRE